MTARSLKTLALAGTVSTLAVTAALAQDEVIQLDAIIVYGDRSTDQAAESMASLGVVGTEALEDATVTSVQDAYGRLANVQAGDSSLTGFVIRGMNSEGQTPGLGEPLASFYIDGVQQTVEGTRRGSRSAFDTQQLEVYRGPQSTLTGRTAMAGAVYLKTKDPEFTLGGTTQLTYGSDNRRSVGFAVTGPVSDRVALRFSGEWYGKDNDIRYPSYKGYSGYDDITKDEYYTLRGKLLWQATDATRVLLSYAHSYDNPVPDIVASGTGRGDVNGELNALYPLLQANALTLQQGLGIAPENQLGILTVLEEVRNTTTDSFGMEISHEVNSNLNFTAMTGWSSSDTDVRSMNFGKAGELTSAQSEQKQELLTQEFRFNYDSGDLRWVAGLYLGRETRDNFRSGVYFDQGILAGTSTSPVTTLDTTTDIKTTNAALFGEVTYEFAPSWSVIAGGRIDRIKSDTTQTYNGLGSNYSFNDTVALGKLGLAYALPNDDRLTLMLQQGYRPGGAGANLTGTYSFEDETSTVAEISYRGRAMDDRLGYAATVFWQGWNNQQVEVGLFPNNQIVNAGESESWGAEFEMDYAASDMLNIYGALGLLETEFKDFNTGGTNYSGLSFPNAPRVTLAMGYRWGGETGWFSSGVVKYTGKQKSRFDNATPDTLASYTTVDMSIGYAWDQVKLTGYATNLFDKKYRVYENSTSGLQGLGDRREIGIRLDHTF